MPDVLHWRLETRNKNYFWLEENRIQHFFVFAQQEPVCYRNHLTMCKAKFEVSDWVTNRVSGQFQILSTETLKIVDNS